MNWNPVLHPRDPDDGRFVERAGGWLSGLAEQLRGPHERVVAGDHRDSLDYAYLAGRLGADPRKDDALAEIWRANGFDGLPRVVNRQEMDDAVASGWTELFRGVGKTQEEGTSFSDQFRTGDPYPGLGGFGNGIYAMPDWRRQATAGYGKSTMRMALHPQAKTVEADDIIAEMRGQGYTDFGAGPGDPDHVRVLSDVGRYASAAGYDAVAIRQLQSDMTRGGSVVEWLILNRTALAVQDTDVDPYAGLPVVRFG